MEIVTVTTVPVARVDVAPTTDTLDAGGTVQLSATPRAANGTALTGRTVTWESSDTDVARVSSSGLVTAVAGGTATVTATSEGRSGTATITVRRPVARVVITPGSATIAYKGSPREREVRLTATAYDADGDVVTGLSVTWFNSNTSAASVSGTGLVTGVNDGVANVTAIVGGRLSTPARITVIRSFTELDAEP
jgi:uncharacterized protein YjdB